MTERKSFITEDTEIIINEEAFEANAKQLICELFVEYVNNKHQATVVVLKQ